MIPGSNQAFGEGAVGFAGAAQDNVAVVAIEIAVRRNDSQQWLHANGTWGGFAWINGSLSDPGAATTDWSLAFTPPTAGAYGMMARSVDAAGNTGAMTWRSFTSAGPGGGAAAAAAAAIARRIVRHTVSAR